MVTDNNHVILSQPSVLVFKGYDYGRWSLPMKMVFRSQDLWDLVEKGLVEDEAKDRENLKKDAKALSIIQQAVDEPILD